MITSRVVVTEDGPPEMQRNNQNYIGGADETIEQRCNHCEWTTVEHSYSSAVEAYQDHLRNRHPRAWVRE